MRICTSMCWCKGWYFLCVCFLFFVVGWEVLIVQLIEYITICDQLLCLNNNHYLLKLFLIYFNYNSSGTEKLQLALHLSLWKHCCYQSFIIVKGEHWLISFFMILGTMAFTTTIFMVLVLDYFYMGLKPSKVRLSFNGESFGYCFFRSCASYRQVLSF